MPARYFKDQYDDETMLMLFRRHIVIIRKQFLVAGLVIVLAMLPVFFWVETLKAFWISLLIGVLVAGLIVMYGWMCWYYSVFIVTDKRFIQITQQGFFDKSVVDINLEQIQMVNYQIKGLQETLLSFGTVSIQTMVGELSIKTVARPAKVQRELSRILKDRVKIFRGNQYAD